MTKHFLERAWSFIRNTRVVTHIINEVLTLVSTHYISYMMITLSANWSAVTKIESKVMKFPDKIIVFLGQMELRGNEKKKKRKYYSFDMSKATDNNSNNFLAWKVQPAWHLNLAIYFEFYNLHLTQWYLLTYLHL